MTSGMLTAFHEWRADKGVKLGKANGFLGESTFGPLM